MEYKDGILTYTLKEELKVYEKEFEIHKLNIRFAKETNKLLNGMCGEISKALLHLYNITSFSFTIYHSFFRFAHLKPKNVFISDYWWSRKNTNRTRYNKYLYLISEVKKEIEQQ